MAIYAAIMTFMLVMCSISASAEETNEPMNKGDKWAFGAEEDFSELFDEFFNEIQPELDSEVEGFVDYSYGNEGTIGVYYVSEVLDDANNLYKVQSELGIYIHTYAEVVAVFDNIPKEGNHTNVTEGEDEKGHPTWDGAPTAGKTVRAMAGFDIVVKVISTNYYTRDTLSLDHTNITFYVGIENEMAAVNFPEIMYGDSTYNDEDESETYDWMDVRYHDISLGGVISIDLNLNLAFEQAVNMFDLPIKEGDIWNGTTNITASGDLGGTFDIREPMGVPDHITQEFYSTINQRFAEIEIDKIISQWSDLFPVHIPNDWIPVDDLDENITIENNRFVLPETPSPEPVNYSFTTGEKRNVTLPSGTIVEAFEIIPYDEDEHDDDGDDEGDRSRGEDDYEEEEYLPFQVTNFISGEDGRLVKMEAEIEVLEEAGIELEADPVEPTTAESALDSKADPGDPKSGGVNTDRDIGYPEEKKGDDDGIPGPIATGTLAALCVATVMVMRKGKPRGMRKIRR